MKFISDVAGLPGFGFTAGPTDEGFVFPGGAFVCARVGNHVRFVMITRKVHTVASLADEVNEPSTLFLGVPNLHPEALFRLFELYHITELLLLLL